MTTPTPGRTVVAAWLVSGTLDIAAALIYYPLTTQATALRILQGIASGVVGASAFSGGLATATLGLVLHYAIALIWTIVFFAGCSAIPWLRRSPFPVAVGYGLFVWSVMNLIVLPLSRVRRGPLTLDQAIVAAVFLIFCIGLPNAVICGRYFRRQEAPARTL